MKKNPVVFFEIYAKDPDKLGQFYTTLFEWAIEPIKGIDYRIMKTIETDARGMPLQGGINGGLMRRPEGYEDRAWLNYVLVKSVEAAADRAQKLGASVVKGKSPVPGMGWFAMLTDPEGNLFAVWQPDTKAK
jgi:hypothetical protein